MAWYQTTIRERSAVISALSMKNLSAMTQNVTSQGTSAIELRDVTKRFLTPKGQAYTAIRNVTFSVAPGEFVAVVGPTGRSEERRVGKSVDLGGRRIIKK